MKLCQYEADMNAEPCGELATMKLHSLDLCDDHYEELLQLVADEDALCGHGEEDDSSDVLNAKYDY